MDNKEEILGLPFYPHDCGSMIECVTKQDALKAMDIHSKKTAIAFAEFILFNPKLEKCTDGEHAWYEDGLGNPVEIEELYLQSLNK